MNASLSCFVRVVLSFASFFSHGEMRLLDDGLGSPEQLDQLLALVEGRRLVAAADALAADEDPGHGSTPGQNAHVVLDFAGLRIARNVFDQHQVIRNVVGVQNTLGSLAEWARSLFHHKDWVVADEFVDILSHCHVGSV